MGNVWQWAINLFVTALEIGPVNRVKVCIHLLQRQNNRVNKHTLSIKIDSKKHFKINETY